MRALELVVFEKEPGRYGGEPRYNSPDGLWAYPASHVDGYAQGKRLSDAELAAEYHSACAEHAWIDRGLALGASTTRDALDSYSTTQILHRFATLPHYDEDHQ